MRETLPTEHDQKHITALAQKLLDAAQDYARDNDMSFPGVVSSIGTMTGAFLARAYNDINMVRSVGGRLSIVAVAFAEKMLERGQRDLPRKQ
jgi:hypothetical protein